MRFLDNLFSVFSRRIDPASERLPPITPTFRKRVVMLCCDMFDRPHYIGPEFWAEVHRKLQYLHGSFVRRLIHSLSSR